MRTGWLLLAVPVVLVVVGGALAEGGGAKGSSKETIDLLRQTEAGGECVIEFDADGGIVAVEAGIPLSAVPQVCRDAADKLIPGGKAVAAEREWSLGKAYWEVVKEVDGVRYEVLMNDDGTLAGKEASLKDPPAALVEAAKKAIGGGELVVAEEVSGPEAAYGESHHIKLRKDGEVLRVSVKSDGSVVRVMRKMRAEVRVPK